MTQRLTPSQQAVLSALRGRPDGTCRRDFARLDIWEPSKRIGELRELGFVIEARSHCTRHHHRNRLKEYLLRSMPAWYTNPTIEIPIDNPDAETLSSYRR